MVRLIPDFHGPVDPGALEGINEIIQARIDGGITRRQLIRRATQIGIAAPVVGVMLHATSDMAFGAPSNARDMVTASLQDATTIPVTGPTAPTGTPIEGGTVVASTTDEPDSLNPWITQLVSGSDLYQGVCEGLLRYDSNQQLFPLLSDSFTISEDGLTYTFKLRAGVTFHNGEPFNAHTIISNFNGVMYGPFGAVSQLGWDQVTGFESPDDTTIVMTTGTPYA
ncbi:MAG TPA: ABC transporter substrate-binding protein, partial [Thermomicrobiales bacterium]|nr:ABC transporter substrate-binding protein [Thermomicrobiales bacterium]